MRNLLARLLQFLTSYVELLQDLVDEECEILHEHLILLEQVSLDQAEYLPQWGRRDVLHGGSLGPALSVNHHRLGLDVGHDLIPAGDIDGGLFELESLELLAEDLRALGLLAGHQTLKDVLHE